MRKRTPLGPRDGFTLMEMIVVVVILGVLAALAIPSYVKTVERARLQDAITQLRTVHSAEQMYKARNGGSFWPTDGAAHDVTAINANLGLNLIENGMTYSCTGSGANFTCTAVRTGDVFTVTVTEDAISSSNPACTAGTCP